MGLTGFRVICDSYSCLNWIYGILTSVLKDLLGEFLEDLGIEVVIWLSG